jgi:DHA1 family bicyclomycin/chloramphenicol resistance-like MFS transporter
MDILILGRALQAVGSGTISSVSMAIVKNMFKGRIMESVLVWIQTMTILYPMAA